MGHDIETRNSAGSLLESHQTHIGHSTIKKHPEWLLKSSMIHCISTGSNIVHDDNALLHNAQVVTECIEWHDNNVSHMPMSLL